MQLYSKHVLDKWFVKHLTVCQQVLIILNFTQDGKTPSPQHT